MEKMMANEWQQPCYRLNPQHQVLCRFKTELIFLGSFFMRPDNGVTKGVQRPQQPCCLHAKPRTWHSVWPFSYSHRTWPRHWPTWKQEPANQFGPNGQMASTLQHPQFPPSHEGRNNLYRQSRKLAKQRHLPCSLNMPEETFSKPFMRRHYDSGKKKQSTTPRHVRVHTNPTACSAGPTSKKQNSKYNSREWPLVA